MPPVVQKGMTVTVLTAIISSSVIAIFMAFGQTAVEAHNTTITMPFFIKTMNRIEDKQGEIISDMKSNKTIFTKQIEKLDDKNTAFIVYLHENELRDAKLEDDIDNCINKVDYCNSKHKGGYR